MLSSGAFTHHGGIDSYEGAISARRAGFPLSDAVAALVGDLRACQTIDALRGWLARYAERHAFRGGRYVHFGHLAGRNSADRKALRFLATCQDYADLDWPDPGAGLGFIAFLPFAWTLRNLDGGVDDRRPPMAVTGLDEVLAGVTIPIQDYRAGPAQMTLFGADEAAASSLVQTGGPSLLVTALVFHLLAKALIPKDDASGVLLSERELACLRMAASGETLVRTADGLGVSVRTVELHLGRATKKLSALNKTHAVAIAVGAGLLQV